jgi:hypothetical protein
MESTTQETLRRFGAALRSTAARMSVFKTDSTHAARKAFNHVVQGNSADRRLHVVHGNSVDRRLAERLSTGHRHEARSSPRPEPRRGQAYLHCRHVRAYMSTSGVMVGRRLVDGRQCHQQYVLVSTRETYLHATKGYRDRLRSRRVEWIGSAVPA